MASAFIGIAHVQVSVIYQRMPDELPITGIQLFALSVANPITDLIISTTLV